MSSNKLNHEHARTVLTAVLLALSVGSAGLANDVDPALVQRLIEQLADSSRKTRVAAEQTLQELGPSVLSHLPAPERLTSAAQRDAVRRLRTLLERQQAEATAHASRVTLSGTHTLREIMQALADQTGNRVAAEGLTNQTLDQRIDVDWNETSFWTAVPWVETRAALRSRLSDDGQQLQFVLQQGDIPPASMTAAGAFRIVGRSLVCRPNFIDAQRDIVRVQFEVHAEPRLRPLFVRVEHGNFQLAAGDKVLSPLNVAAKLERPAERRSATPLTIDFVTTKPCDVDRATLTGRVDIELAAAEERFVFRNLDTSERVARRRGGVVVTLDRVTFKTDPDKTVSSARVDLRVAYDSTGPAFESHRTWVFHNAAILQTNDGEQQWSPSGFDTTAEAEAAVRLSYRFENIAVIPSELQFVYSAPTLLLTVPAEFELSDILRDALSVE